MWLGRSVGGDTPVTPSHGLLAAGPGLDWSDPYAAALLVLGLAVFAAIGALSHQADRAFSASLVYLAIGLGGRRRDRPHRARLARSA